MSSEVDMIAQVRIPSFFFHVVGSLSVWHLLYIMQPRPTLTSIQEFSLALVVTKPRQTISCTAAPFVFFIPLTSWSLQFHRLTAVACPMQAFVVSSRKVNSKKRLKIHEKAFRQWRMYIISSQRTSRNIIGSTHIPFYCVGHT